MYLLNKLMDILSSTKALIVFLLLTWLTSLADMGKLEYIFICLLSYSFGCWSFKEVKKRGDGTIIITEHKGSSFSDWMIKHDIDVGDLFFGGFMGSLMLILLFWTIIFPLLNMFVNK
jgi:hypothetical protein